MGEPPYGRAAKLIAIYLKVLVVAGGHAGSPFAERLHPPVDNELLKALSRDRGFPREWRTNWRAIAWTRLDEDGYFALIESFRAAGLDRPAFWRIERYWSPELASSP